MSEPTLGAPCGSDVLAPGTSLGPYEIEGLIGSGGMGQVYRAHDPRLGRRVAIKTLSGEAAGAGSEGRRRFEVEARAAGALDHPNLLTVYDVGQQGDVCWIVSELLEGETLRERLGRHGPLGERQAVDIALQTARGLAAAHARGIVHRDLKPENLFLTRDRGVKILDFGVAKLLPMAEQRLDTATGLPMTMAGMVVGTAGYMAPEQANGLPVDPRADLFVLGVVLHEMLGGRAPFHRDTPLASMNAVNSEPAPPLPAQTSPALAAVVARCLEKAATDRYQSANEVIIALDLLAASLTSGSLTARTQQTAHATYTRRQALGFAAAGAAAGLLAGLGGGLLRDGFGAAGDALPASFRRLTFRRGLIRSARFAPDGRTILYGALWDGERCRVQTVRLDGPESSVLDLPAANLLAVSPSGELALSLGSHRSGIITYGTLARASMGGGAPRELTEQVKFADWSPDGAALALVRREGDGDLLEYPAGTALLRPGVGEQDGLGFARVSADGERVAFVRYRTPGSLVGQVCVTDRQGRSTALTDEYINLHGLAWRGEEIWFTAADQQPLFRALCAVRPGRAARIVLRAPANITLWDIAANGDIVVAQTDDRGAMFVQQDGAAVRDLSWLDASTATDLSPDGRLLLFDETGQGGGPDSAVYLRGTDGSAAVRLASGRALALSPDARWALCAPAFTATSQLDLVPTGAGRVRRIVAEGLNVVGARFLPGGANLALEAYEADQRVRLYHFDLDSGRHRAITPEGVRSWALAPDGSAVAAQGPQAAAMLYPITDGDARPAPGAQAGESVMGWIDSGLLLRRAEDPISAVGAVQRLDLQGGQRNLFSNILPPDGAGLMTLGNYCVTPDGRTQAYDWHRALSNLYVARGLA